MTTATRKTLLRANALYLRVASVAGLRMDVPGTFFSRGPDPWHLTGSAVHFLLGTSNLVFWQIFIAADILWAGYLTTSLHCLFALLQLWAAVAAGRSISAGSLSSTGPACRLEFAGATVQPKCDQV